MTLLTRISRLFRADFHALLDNLEEPDVLLRQAIREMQEAIELDRQHENQRTADLERLVSRRNELENNSAAIANELDICLSANREALARSLIKRRLENEILQAKLTQKIQALEKSLADLRTRLQDQQQRLANLRQKASLFEEEQRSECLSTDNDSTIASVGDDEIEIALLREKQRRMPT